MIEYCIARKEYLGGILALYSQLVPDDVPIGYYKAAAIWEKALHQGTRYFAAVDGDRVVGSLYMALIQNLSRDGRPIGFIENVITDAQYRRKGIGKKLISMAVDYGKENNCYKIVLLSNTKRKEAHLFYKDCGFDGDSKHGFEMRF